MVITINWYYVLAVTAIVIMLFKIRLCSKCGKLAWKYSREEQDWSGARSCFYKGVVIHRNKYVYCPFCGYKEIGKSKEITSKFF